MIWTVILIAVVLLNTATTLYSARVVRGATRSGFWRWLTHIYYHPSA